MGVSLCITCCFSLAAFNILLLSLIFAISVTICLGMVLFGLILFGTLCFLDLDVCFLSQVRKVFQILCLQICSLLLCLSFPIWDPCNMNFSTLDVVLGSLKWSSFIYYLVFLFSFSDFHYSVFQLTDPFLCIILSTVDAF